MYNKIVLVVSLLGLLQKISAQILQDGQCDQNIPLQENFNPALFNGTWYEVRSTSFSDCASIIINEASNGYDFQFESVVKNFEDNANAIGTLETGTAKFSLNYGDRTEDFWVLGTGYTTYAVAYRCENVGTTQRNVYVKLLSRSRTINDILTVIINNTLAIADLSIPELRATDHSDDACLILPTIAPGQSVVLPGTCNPNIRQVANFDVSRFLGLWHQQYSYHSENGQGTCNRAQYTLGNGVVNVLNSQVVNRALDTISGSAVLDSNSDSKLLVTLEVLPGVNIEQELFVIATDYDNYAISYTCIPGPTAGYKTVFSWIVSRTRIMPAAVLEDVTAVVDSVLDLNFAYYQEADQTREGCFYYPEPSPNQVVEFRATCNLDIPTVTNFQPTRYMGKWYDIESYPSGFQEGTCNTADYTLRDGVVDVFNTQVVNQALDTMTGVGVVASTDGSAKLEVTFPVAGTNFTVTTSYWVLDTDYDNYALVFTCEYDASTDMRRVWSWKLSRERTLSDSSRANIDIVINRTPELDQRYYIVRDFSDAGCFYFPEFTGEPVIFPGTCANTIPVVTNFNIAELSGTWYEIAAYPKRDSNSCYRYEIAPSTNGVNVNAISVFNNNGQSTNQVLTLSSTDGSARFVTTVDIFGVGNPIEVPVWILAFDNSDYAFAYSCFQTSPNFRQVSAWKLSRTQELSNTATTTINNIVATIDVLVDQYFEVSDRSERSCTVLPDIPSGQPIILEGQCEVDVDVVQNFQAGQYVGTWHLIETYPSAFQDGTCNDATYTAEADGSVTVFNTQVINQTLDTITGRAVLASTDGSAKLDVTFPDAPTSLPYWVIATDYESYSLVYTCINLTPTTRQVWSWKLSRTRSFTPEARAAIDQAINGVTVLNQRYYEIVDNTPAGCFYYPVPDGNSVSFRGLCDESIPVVTNFDAVAYMGSWYDIESYPQTFQEGTCSTADYALVDGGVDVFNTQVVNQRLDTIVGRAVVTNPDSTEAKLTVTFPIAGTNFTIDSPYWVLATDYSSYSLVYACQNLPNDRRSVSSWKLSRERTLSNAANTAINNVIANIDVLRQDYYEVKGHTDADCFYFPEPSGEPVVFRATCDNTIQAVPNFDLTRFVGVWNEIETYPKEEAGGDCINHEFSVTLSNDTLSLISNQVFNSEDLVSNVGEIRLASTDGSGRFTLTMEVNNQTIVIPYWVLATDYESYALVYSCMDRPDGRSAVHAWKLSKTKELSSEANNNINSAMEQVTVLRQEYFVPVPQTDRACFYLPSIGNSEPVLFPGVCAQNIPVLPNFNANRFSGTWYDIESYFDDYVGTCIDGTFTVTSNGYDVVLTQVVGQTLDTTISTATLAADNSGKLIVSTNNVEFEYWILDTDYDSWSLVYSCQNVGNNQRRVRSWKMSRTRQLTNDAANAIAAIINEIDVLNERFFNTRDHSAEGCFYYPVPDGNPVSFRGRCDEFIPVVTNFDAVAYMGSWYDIESYPQTFQEGSCSTADYALVDGGVDVFNTQVVNQRLDTIVGRAVVTNPDSTEAKLTVTFPIAGTNLTIDSPYWVLATDYSSYSLVYACQNLPNDRRSVTSWKLSRERTLSNAANTAINNVIANIDVLRQDYYEVKGHTDEDCFYFPEPSGEPVVFRATCDNTIQAVPNFDLTRFVGVWNEIETYPKEEAGGDCINHEFSVTLSNDTLSLISNQVFNSEDLVSNVGEIRLASTDGSGRFTLTMEVNNQTIVIPYWVLATDYESYALVYSCMDRPDGRSAVYAWKLSKTKQLSSEANNNINAAMEQVTVLRQEYFVPVPQTDRACFYIPSIGNSEPVLFPGVCAQNIPVVANFNANRYAGTWYDIESYFDDYEGTCIDGTFTETSNGFDVVLTQVVNQELDTTISTATLAADNSGKLIVSTNNVQFEYWILDTDYDSWSLVYSCQNVGNNQRRVRSWKMSRTRQLTNDAASAIAAIVNEIDVLNERFFNTRDHSVEGCFYFPEPNGRPVVFRARCDETIPVVQNFDAAAYLGQWYNIETYPQAFQDGTCSAALYSLGDGVVDVYNTQVLNQRLDTMNGTAVVVSDDGSAKLSVTFFVNGVENVAPYWVLATDYTDYAFVYSCRDIDEENVLISAWKLSRGRELSSAADAVINGITTTIPVIQQRYYIDVGQTEEDCFFYPENFGGPVELPGQCPERNAAGAITNFNANQFAGTWHEVARFPSELQTGECASSQYTVSGQNAFSINKNIVYNETLITSTGPGTLGNDGLGVISVSLTGEQFSTNMDIYILDTDYTEFALAYACRNIDSSTKQIYSWQLSKSRSGLSQAAQDRIDAVVDANIDLFGDYYEPTQQTDDACFYYPEFEVLPEVIELPGPCDESIRGVANFDAASYLGQWYETARYPQPDQAGACNRAEYTLGNNVVDVYNTQVVDRILEIQRGFAEVASTDGTGQLEVTFDVNNVTVTANYYIMATNYVSYSLVYSCRNTANGNRLVASWKLSRDKVLSAADEQTMSEVIARTQGLRESYYTSTSQSDADCFYVPDLDENNSVRFRGRCEDISVGIPNFNVNRFLGLWHEIERYPSGNDDGVCTSANFRSINVVDDKTVFDVTAQINTNTVSISSEGLITRTGDASSVWVIATDYDSYAVLFNCRNIDDEYRVVWSAKHSRARSLETAAEQAIAEVIASNDLLYQHLYVRVDQSDNACFYYPEVTGQPVTMPGQCDDDIPIMENFSVEEYGGTWYQIERYPQFWETGNCTGARYTLDEATGVVDVTNWQVINGELDVIEGNATLIGTDGRARIWVVLPSREEGGEGGIVTFELNVLTTDYVTYSLAYSCVNLNQYERRLGVWKLSRTRSLPTVGTTAINNYMAQRQELDQRYFINVGQDENCEEPSSSFVVRSSIIAMLVCSILQLVL